MKKNLAAAAVLAVVATAGLLGVPGTATAHEDAPATQETAAALGDVRAATAKYQDVARANADGFVQSSPCISDPGGSGFMGYHYVNTARLDGTLDAAEPEVLIYNEEANGRMRLVAVEYIVIGLHQATFPGGVGMHAGPFPGTQALHAWVWKHNPSGVFADFNPNAHC